MPLIITYHQICNEDGEHEVVGYYDYLDTSFVEQEDCEIERILEKERIE